MIKFHPDYGEMAKGYLKAAAKSGMDEGTFSGYSAWLRHFLPEGDRLFRCMGEAGVRASARIYLRRHIREHNSLLRQGKNEAAGNILDGVIEWRDNPSCPLAPEEVNNTVYEITGFSESRPLRFPPGPRLLPYGNAGGGILVECREAAASFVQ